MRIKFTKKASVHIRFSFITFTLLELLIVISIIFVLAGILLPALGKAKATVYSISCMNNMSQIGKASFCYFEDYGHVFPKEYQDADGNWHSWVYKNSKGYIYTYLGCKEGVPHIGYIRASNQDKRCPFACPVHKSTLELDFSYRFNYSVLNDSGTTYSNITNIVKIYRPSETDMFFESDNSASGSLYVQYNYPTVFRHNIYFNLVYFDGHTGKKSMLAMQPYLSNAYNIFCLGVNHKWN